MIEIYIILFILCMIISAFFSSSETAFISMERVRIRHMVNHGVSGAEDMAKLTEKPEKLLTTVLIGNNFVNTAAATLGTLIVLEIIDSENWGALVATIGVTILLLVFCDIIPKTLATRLGERMALLYTRPLKAVSLLFFPLTFFLSGIGSGVARLFGGNAINQDIITEDEIRTMILMGLEDGSVEEDEADMAERVLLFGDRLVSEIMTPRTDVVWLENDITLNDFWPVYIEKPHTRFPVYDENVDNVIGVLWIKDVLMSQAKGEMKGSDVVTSLVRPTGFVPETKIIGALFRQMQEERTQVLIVVDEYGGTAGIVTMEQLVEEIVGQLGDELATGDKTVETIAYNTYKVDGGKRIDQANEELDINLPEGDYETVAGFVLSVLGYIPKEGEQLMYGDIMLTVTDMKGVKIEKILIVKK